MNGIHKNDKVVSWLVEPIFEFLSNEITRTECVNQLKKRLEDLKRERVGNVEVR